LSDFQLVNVTNQISNEYVPSEKGTAWSFIKKPDKNPNELYLASTHLFTLHDIL